MNLRQGYRLLRLGFAVVGEVLGSHSPYSPNDAVADSWFLYHLTTNLVHIQCHNPLLTHFIIILVEA